MGLYSSNIKNKYKKQEDEGYEDQLKAKKCVKLVLNLNERHNVRKKK